jgi:hypothetical protein
MTVHEEKLKRILCEAIENRQSIRFYHESRSSGKKGWRIVEPYIIGIKRTGNVFLAGMPVEERTKSIDERITGHYLLRKIEQNKLEIRSKTYSEPKVRKATNCKHT